MKTRPDIESQINKAFDSVKNTEPVELPFDFSDKVMNRLHSRKNNVRMLYPVHPLLKIAAVLILILVNMFTLKLALTPQPAKSTAQYTTLKDFVNDYQINDTNDELVTINTSPSHE